MQLTADLAIHSWDLARATGQDDTLGAGTVGLLLPWAQATVHRWAGLGLSRRHPMSARRAGRCPPPGPGPPFPLSGRWAPAGSASEAHGQLIPLLEERVFDVYRLGRGSLKPGALTGDRPWRR
jgi:hypothetical protein